MKTLNAEVLHEIAIETRQCFLSEDAPNYLINLQKGLAQIQLDQPDYIFLMHAAHSLKGGSAIAELMSLSKLAHKLEDMLEILQHNKFGDEFCDRATISELLSHSIDEVASVISQAISLPTNSLIDIEIDLELLQRLDSILENVKVQESNLNIIIPSNNTQLNNPQLNISQIIISSLEKDLENCIKQVETNLLANSVTLPEARIREELQYFCEECFLLGDTLSLDWLVNTVEPFEAYLQQKPAIALLLSETRLVINSVRSQRSQYLHPQSEAILEIQAIATPSPDQIPDLITELVPELIPEAISYLRIPCSQIESMTNTVAEMILRHERLLRQQQQLGKTNKNLQSLVLQMVPLQDQVQKIYDELANNQINKQATIDSDFDQLELDQYSSSHSTLQNLQEVLLRVKENRSDIDLSYRELGEEIEYLRQDLDRIYTQLTQSRLVPFKNLANRFLPQLKRLCQRYNKQVELVILGEDVPIDQVILEQLQTPLNHLLINAFDHGIESPETRSKIGKPETAIITIGAVVSGNQVIISLKDDGDGINLNEVYAKAIEKNICSAKIPVSDIPRQEILDFIFQPNFSTRNAVSEMSGRGMGMDIVRSQINRLRGNIQVETWQGEGTTFTIKLPLGLSLVTLLTCAVGENAIAILANDILDIFPYAEAQFLNQTPNQINSPEISWRRQVIPLLHLKQTLPYSDRTNQPINPKVCLVLNRSNLPIAVAVDMIIEERQLILKPFDRSVAIPSYLTGCTILGTGQVIPVLVPDNLHLLLQKNIAKTKKINKKPNQTTNPTINQKAVKTILIAEDSIATRNMLERLLKQLDFEVIACRDGQEAIDVLTRLQGKVSMVISDLEMPRVNGFDLLQTIRTHDSWYALPVVMLTSRTGDRHRQKATSLGANGYLSKPIVVGELIHSLEELLPSQSMINASSG